MTDTLPVNPMLAELTPAPAGGRFGHPFTSDRYAYELKWDGHRIIASISNRGVQLWARSGRLVTPDYQEIADAVAALDLPVVADHGTNPIATPAAPLRMLLEVHADFHPRQPIRKGVTR